MPVLVLRFLESNPHTVPLFTKLAVENLARALGAGGVTGLEAAKIYFRLLEEKP